MSRQIVKVPDIGTEEAAEVVEVLVNTGDTVAADDSLIVLETEKASVEVPSSHGGQIVNLLVKAGDQVKTGDAIAELELAGEGAIAQEFESGEKEDEVAELDPAAAADTALARPASSQAPTAQPITVTIPDLGGATDVDVIEVPIKVGDHITEGDSLLVLETEKASTDIPSPHTGEVRDVLVSVGDKVKEGDKIVVLMPAGQAPVQPVAERPADLPDIKEAKDKPAPAPSPVFAAADTQPADGSVYAGPAVRKLARQLGVDLAKVKGTGPRGRCSKDDVRLYVREIIAGKGGAAIPAVPAVDFAQFGDISRVKLSKIKKSTAANMHRSWLNVPHVTQFDEADITELESRRKDLKSEADERGLKLTPLPFLLKACAQTLRDEPSFNVSLDADGEHMIEKNFVHIGIAVDTPSGLLVPVIRDVDQKDVWQLAKETVDFAQQAREGKLAPRDMKGGCFTISSLGAIGGQGFTPIVNTPEVGILGVSKAAVKPSWDGKSFVPRTMLPLSLSYDHRAVNGADAGRFLTRLVELLQQPQSLI